MSASKKVEKESKDSARIYCRCRCVFPWEKQQKSVKINGTTVIQNKTNRRNNAYTFHHVFNEDTNNEDLFEKICTPLINNVVDGHNAVLIAYGQTGSGKTHSLVGKPEQNIQGLLPRTLHRLLEFPSVTKVELLACEAYGVHVARIEIFDLFSPDAAPPDWNEKKGRGTFNIQKAQRRELTKPEDSDTLIDEAHAASHFAPTAKNPESSRGHTVFVIRVEQEEADGMSSRTSYFVVADLAGSEGESAITKEFVQNNNPTTVMVRRLEAGCINAGLCQLQLIFAELRKRQKLSRVVGNGLRRLLHPFINTNTHISVLFTVAPTKTNATITESTLKFAVQAGMVKVKPVASVSKKNIKKLLKELENTVSQQEGIINQKDVELEEKDEQIEMLENELDHLRDENERLEESGGTGAPSNHLSPKRTGTPKKVRTHKRTATAEHADQLFSNLNAFVAELEGDDDHYAAPSPQLPLAALAEADEDGTSGGEFGWGGTGELAPVPSNVSMSKHFPKVKTEQEIEIDKQVYSRSRARNSIRFEQSVLSHIGIDSKMAKILNEEDESDDEEFAYNEDLLLNVGETEEAGEYQNFDDLEDDDREKLIEKIESLKTMLKEKDVICEQYKQAQIVMMDHLAETNEALFHFFKVRYRIPGQKNERGTGVYEN